MSQNDAKILLGSNTAKGGFQNERDVIDKFNNWKNDLLSQEWLQKMGYNLSQIEYVKAVKVTGSYKADIQVQIQVSIKLKGEIDCQNISVKLVSNPTGFNQIDKRWSKKYAELWNIDEKTLGLLKYFTGENPPRRPNTRDNRRMFIDEFDFQEQEHILNFFRNNRLLIISDLLKGRGTFSAEWMLVILKSTGNDDCWALEPINHVMNFYDGEVKISPQGSLSIGKITMQRKGGDGGRDTAKMLQFKFNPALLIKKIGKQS